jgi:aconitate hydratase 2/2-methylisocitrate dehydratase
VVSTSTRNFPNRLGNNANVYLSSAELAAVAAIEGKLPTVEQYMKYAKTLNATAADTYRYLNFDQIKSYMDKANSVIPVKAAS